MLYKITHIYTISPLLFAYKQAEYAKKRNFLKYLPVRGKVFLGVKLSVPRWETKSFKARNKSKSVKQDFKCLFEAQFTPVEARIKQNPSYHIERISDISLTINTSSANGKMIYRQDIYRYSNIYKSTNCKSFEFFFQANRRTVYFKKIDRLNIQFFISGLFITSREKFVIFTFLGTFVSI